MYMEENIKISECADVMEIARLHKSIFRDHLLGMLSVKLIKAFYEEYNDGENILL